METATPKQIGTYTGRYYYVFLFREKFFLALKETL